jgi:hypothetical protein
MYNNLSQRRYSKECNGNKHNRKICFTADLPKPKENTVAKLSSYVICFWLPGHTGVFFLPAIDIGTYMFVEVNWPEG